MYSNNNFCSVHSTKRLYTSYVLCRLSIISILYSFSFFLCRSVDYCFLKRKKRKKKSKSLYTVCTLCINKHNSVSILCGGYRYNNVYGFLKLCVRPFNVDFGICFLYIRMQTKKKKNSLSLCSRYTVCTKHATYI